METPYVVRAVNTGPKPFIITHNREQLVVPANGDRVVPWDAMVSLWGDPATIDDRNRTRHDYGMLLRGGFGWFAGLNTEADWAERRPSIEWFTLEGERVWTVLDDPSGEKAAAGVVRPMEQGSDSAFLMQTIAQLQAQMEQMQSALDQRTAQVAEAEAVSLTTESGDLPQPDPNEGAATVDAPAGPKLRGRN